MTDDQPAFEPIDEQTPPSQYVPEPPDMLEELPYTEPQYPIHLKMEFDPLELGDAQDFSESDQRIDTIFNAAEHEETVVVPMEFLETPDGYSAPRFEDSEAAVDSDADLDTLFSELSETASGQSVDIAVWCPWLIDTP
ncbi:MAG TPA: hypothetical protein PLR25_07280 [Planctomycetaceae bacterium]|nr:hypothetical protein [Planctomycetaceae bacterium]